MTLNLFALRNTVSKKLLTEYFPNKPAARTRRDELNQAEKQVLYAVTPGPSHRRFKPS